jgi:hypothetical protein
VETFVQKLQQIVERFVEEPKAEMTAVPSVREDMPAMAAAARQDGESFDSEEYKQSRLEDFAARQRLREKLARRQVWEAGSAAKANELAHEINNPLQSLTNTFYLAQQGGENAETYLREASSQLTALSELVRNLLESGSDRGAGIRIPPGSWGRGVSAETLRDGAAGLRKRGRGLENISAMPRAS